MEALEIQLEKRTQTGKGAARKARASGRIPGILYGHGQPPVMFDVDDHGFGLTLEKSPYGRNQLFSVRGVDRDVEVIIRELQIHPISRRILHVDFIQVTDDDRVTVEIEVKPRGRAAGQSAGGSLLLLKRTVKVTCAPRVIPSSIDFDISPLGVGDEVTVGELPLPEGAVAVGDPKVVVIRIKPPRVSAKAPSEEDEKKKKK